MSGNPADAGNTAETAFTDSAAGQQFAGKAVSFPRASELLPISDSSFTSRTVEDNFRRTAEWLRPFSGRNPEAYQLARVLGGAYATGSVALAMGSAGDTMFRHSLGRIPKLILLSIDLNGTGGQIRGAPGGGLGAGGGNETEWTANVIYVRATLSSDYAFIVL